MRGNAPTLLCAPPPSHHLCQLAAALPVCRPASAPLPLHTRRPRTSATHLPHPPPHVASSSSGPAYPPALSRSAAPDPYVVRAPPALHTSTTCVLPACHALVRCHARTGTSLTSCPCAPVAPPIPIPFLRLICHASLRRRPICIVRCARAASSPFLCGLSGTAPTLYLIPQRVTYSQTSR